MKGLACERCSSGLLHHFIAVVYEREDDGPVKQIIAWQKPMWHPTPYEIPTNPSLRRDAVAIGMQCEECDHVSWLSVAQRKGYSYLAARVEGE